MAESIVQVTEGSGKKLHTFNRTIGANSVEDEVVLQGEQYLAHYFVSNLGAVSTATAASHLMQIMAGASLNVLIRRIRVFQVGLATTAAIARLTCQRLTTAGTGGGTLTPQPADSSDAAAGATVMTLPTVKGTETSNPIRVAAPQFIQTVPTGGIGAATLLADFDFSGLRSKSLRIAAGTTNGLAVKMVDAVAGATVVVEIEFSEANFS